MNICYTFVSMKIFQQLFSHRIIWFFSLFIYFIPTLIFATDPTSYTAPAIEATHYFIDNLENFVGYLILLILKIFATLLSMVALLFDNFLAISLSPHFFQNEFIGEAWKSLRDISNVVFIFVFIYLAFQIMLDRNNQWQKTFIKIIIVALLINFSLFASKVIIDAGNITARVFYNNIGFPHDGAALAEQKWGDHFMIAKLFYPPDTQQNFRSVSAQFNSFVAPQNLFGAQSFELWKAKEGGEASLILFIFSVALAILYVILLSVTLFKAGFFLLSRVIYLILYTIVSPLAFVAMLIPTMEGYWTRWLSGIFQKSFCVVVYLFFIWLAAMFLQIDFLQQLQHQEGETYLIQILMFVIKAIFIYIILDQATKIGGKWCGDEGGQMMGGFLKAGRKMVGATGIPALARAGTRNILGNYGSRIAHGEGRTGEFLKKMGEKGFIQRGISQKLWQGGSNLTKMKIGQKSFDDTVGADERRRRKYRNILDDDEKNKYDYAMAGGKGSAGIRSFNDISLDPAEVQDFLKKYGLTDYNPNKTNLLGGNISLGSQINDILKNNGLSKEEILEQQKEIENYIASKKIGVKDTKPISVFDQKTDQLLAQEARVLYPGNSEKDNQKRNNYIKDRKGEMQQGVKVKKGTLAQQIFTGAATDLAYTVKDTKTAKEKDKKEKDATASRNAAQSYELGAAKDKIAVDNAVGVIKSNDMGTFNIGALETELKRLAEDSSLNNTQQKDMKSYYEESINTFRKIDKDGYLNNLKSKFSNLDEKTKKTLQSDLNKLNKAYLVKDKIAAGKILQNIQNNDNYNKAGIKEFADIQKLAEMQKAFQEISEVSEKIGTVVKGSIDVVKNMRISEEKEKIALGKSDFDAIKSAQFTTGTGARVSADEVSLGDAAVKK